MAKKRRKLSLRSEYVPYMSSDKSFGEVQLERFKARAMRQHIDTLKRSVRPRKGRKHLWKTKIT